MTHKSAIIGNLGLSEDIELFESRRSFTARGELSRTSDFPKMFKCIVSPAHKSSLNSEYFEFVAVFEPYILAHWA